MKIICYENSSDSPKECFPFTGCKSQKLSEPVKPFPLLICSLPVTVLKRNNQTHQDFYTPKKAKKVFVHSFSWECKFAYQPLRQGCQHLHPPNHANRARFHAIDLIPPGFNNLKNPGTSSVHWRNKLGFHTLSLALELLAWGVRHTEDKRTRSWSDTIAWFLSKWKYIRTPNLTVLLVLRHQVILYQ